MYLSIHL
jgi:glycerol-3-phosphate dehydrogenase